MCGRLFLLWFKINKNNYKNFRCKTMLTAKLLNELTVLNTCYYITHETEKDIA
jgi:hypothetical protein